MKYLITIIIDIIIIILLLGYCARQTKSDNFETTSIRVIKKEYSHIDSLWNNIDKPKNNGTTN